jgi:hypothetical protein
MAEQSKATPDSSEFSSVGGVVPTSPPVTCCARCTYDIDVAGYETMYCLRCFTAAREGRLSVGAAPTSTPLQSGLIERAKAAIGRMTREAFAECSLAEEVEGIMREFVELTPEQERRLWITGQPKGSKPTSTPLDARQAGRREAIGWLMAQDYRPSPDEIEAWLLAASPASSQATSTPLDALIASLTALKVWVDDEAKHAKLWLYQANHIEHELDSAIQTALAASPASALGTGEKR